MSNDLIDCERAEEDHVIDNERLRAAVKDSTFVLDIASRAVTGALRELQGAINEAPPWPPSDDEIVTLRAENQRLREMIREANGGRGAWFDVALNASDYDVRRADEVEPALRNLGACLRDAGGLCAAFGHGYETGRMYPFGWTPGCGRPAPGWGEP